MDRSMLIFCCFAVVLAKPTQQHFFSQLSPEDKQELGDIIKDQVKEAFNEELEKLQTTANSNAVGFFAYITADIQVSEGQTVVFNNVMFNQGGFYSTSTGIFTCPVNGIYFFGASNVAHPDDKCNFALQVETTPVNAAFCHTTDNEQGVISAIVQCGEGDEVQLIGGLSGNQWIRVDTDSSGTSPGLRHSYFTGALIAQV